jgi:pyrroline-5-carboxylate reductase
MKKLTIIGAGSMAEALLSGIIESRLLFGEDIWVTNRSNEEKLKSLHQQYGVSYTYDLNELFHKTDVVILAMKPKDAAGALQLISPYLTDNMLIVSVMAGISIKSIKMLTNPNLAIVRAMPNTSAAVGKSATALAVNGNVSAEQKEVAKTMFETVGMATIVEEEQLDAVTGLSGSGPAYIYYLIEAMEKSAVEIGLDPQVAQALIVQTLQGAAEMVSKSTKQPKQLRIEVTSPGGTTEAGLQILKAHDVQKAFIDCIKEAAAQSKRMGAKLSQEIEMAKHTL